MMSRWLVLCCAALVTSGAHSADSASTEALLSLLQQQPTEDLALAATGDLPVLSRNDATHLIQLSMHRGWFELAKKIVDVSIASGIDVSHAVHQTANAIKTKLQGVVDHMQDAIARRAATAAAAATAASSAAGTSDDADAAAPAAATPAAVPGGIPPAFEWAQSPDSLLLNVKFSHKLDTPATLGCVSADGLVVAGRSVTFRADCKASRKTFVLALTALRELDAGNSSWSMTSVGRASITLRKAVPGNWPRLLASGGRKPAHMHIWWGMKEKLAPEMEAWEKRTREEADAKKRETVAAAAESAEAGAAKEGAAGSTDASSAGGAIADDAFREGNAASDASLEAQQFAAPPGEVDAAGLTNDGELPIHEEL